MRLRGEIGTRRGIPRLAERRSLRNDNGKRKKRPCRVAESAPLRMTPRKAMASGWWQVARKGRGRAFDKTARRNPHTKRDPSTHFAILDGSRTTFPQDDAAKKEKRAGREWRVARKGRGGGFDETARRNRHTKRYPSTHFAILDGSRTTFPQDDTARKKSAPEGNGEWLEKAEAEASMRLRGEIGTRRGIPRLAERRSLRNDNGKRKKRPCRVAESTAKKRRRNPHTKEKTGPSTPFCERAPSLALLRSGLRSLSDRRPDDTAKGNGEWLVASG